MLGSRPRGQSELLIAGSLRDLIPDDHVLARVDRVLDLGWLRAEVRECYAADGAGRPGIDPEVGHCGSCSPASWSGSSTTGV
jgi:hypothetical protein